ncbi:MAG TPA: tetratricopeptide repeat protein, partial [Chryseosolibacter sp.]|nr:tetratricopeptide repeat protein [Chryseosolibacter sp.]
MKRHAFLVIAITLALQAPAQDVPEVYRDLENNYHQDAFEACVRMEKVVETFIHDRLDTLASNSLFYIGDSYNQLGDRKKALTYFERENKILQSLGMTQTIDFSNSLNNLAYLYLQDGNYISAGITADELIVNDRKIFAPTDNNFVTTVIYVADIYIQLDRLKDAETLLSTTLKHHGKSTTSRGLLLSKLGDLYSFSGEYSRASTSLKEALGIHMEQSGEESPEYTSTAIALGVLYINQGKYPEAQEIFEVALSILDPSDNAYASVLNNHALVLQSLG